MVSVDNARAFPLYIKYFLIHSTKWPRRFIYFYLHFKTLRHSGYFTLLIGHYSKNRTVPIDNARAFTLQNYQAGHFVELLLLSLQNNILWTNGKGNVNRTVGRRLNQNKYCKSNKTLFNFMTLHPINITIIYFKIAINSEP